jgi:hypothetical protein
MVSVPQIVIIVLNCLCLLFICSVESVLFVLYISVNSIGISFSKCHFAIFTCLWLGFYYVLYCVSCWKRFFVCVSLKSVVIFLVSSLLYVKVANFVSRCCEFTFSSCELGCFVTWFIMYLLCCSIFLMMFNSFFFASFVIGCVCNRFVRYLVLLFFYLVGWDLTPIRSLCRSPRFV